MPLPPSSQWPSSTSAVVDITGLSAGVEYRFTAVGVDGVGNVGPQVSHTWASGPCPAVFDVELTSLHSVFASHGTRAIAWSTTSASGIDVEYRLDGDEQWVRTSDSAVTVTVATGVPHTVYARVASPSGCQTRFSPKSPLSATWYEYDAPPGAVSFTSTPPATSSIPFSDFVLSSTGHPRLVSLQYALDGRDWMACDTSFRVGPLAPGVHSVAVRAVDGSGTVFSPLARHTWQVQASTGSSLLLPIAEEGLHTLAVWAVDGLGNRNPDPTVWSWTLDVTPPVVAAALSPHRAVTNAATVVVDVAVSGEEYPQRCDVCFTGSGVLSGGDCTTNTSLRFGYVRDGAAALSVSARDIAGNPSLSTLVVWTWDTSPPATAATLSTSCATPDAGTASCAVLCAICRVWC